MKARSELHVQKTPKSTMVREQTAPTREYGGGELIYVKRVVENAYGKA